MEQQLPVPGTEEVKKAEKERAFNEMLKHNPRPITFTLAEQFVRNLEREKGSSTAVVSTLKQVKGYDLLRVVLKTKNSDAEDVKYEEKASLPIEDRQEYELKYTEVIERVYQQWLNTERPKYLC